MKPLAPASMAVMAYHERSKHHPHRYAASPGHLDWATEPRPFRTFEGAALVRLPLAGADTEARGFSLYDRDSHPVRPFNLTALGRFLELSLGLAAWKSYRGNAWALRVNPSSGNLHPTEAYVILPALPEAGLDPGVFHYHPYPHSLERRARLDPLLWPLLEAHLGARGFLLGLTSIYWREAWKYGERAFRYCNLDVGHALACLSFSAALLGWRLTCLNALSQEDAARVLGLRSTPWRPFEEEDPEILCFVSPATHVPVARDIPQEFVESVAKGLFVGTPNELSRDHVDWEVIREVSSATMKPATPETDRPVADRPRLERENLRKPAGELIRERRSAQAYDGTGHIGRDAFAGILDAALPRPGLPPFDAGLGEIRLHLLLFVHRVRGLDRGLYALVRDDAQADELRGLCRKDFLWSRPGGVFDSLPFYLLATGDLRDRASFASCHQDIAGDSAFSLAMLGRFEDVVAEAPYHYRTLFWEAGMIGQALYLAAEARGLRGTGIGCFFDDDVHSLLGIAGRSHQDLYHFTVGKALEDPRIASYPAYHHLEKSRFT